MNKIHKYLFLTILTVFVFPLFSLGQGTDNLILTIEPKNPEPLQTVSIKLDSYVLDVNKAKITWSVNNEIKKTDIGLKTFNTLSGKNGEKITIKVVAETAIGERYELEGYFIASEVNLAYEYLSYTPPFYKGKALNPYQGLVLITAIPELVDSTGKKIPSQNLVYTWKRNNKTEADSSGIGKNFLVYSGTIPVRDSVVEVLVSSIDNEISTSKSITITNDTPKIVFYEDNPIYGIMFNRAIKTGVRMITDEFKVRAIPYFTTVGYTNSPDLDFKWSLNGSSISNLTDEDKNVMIFRQESEGSGSATVGLKVENNSRIFQFTENSFSLNFEK